MKPFHQRSRFLTICVQVILMIMLSCQSEVDPDNPNNGNNGNNNNNNNNSVLAPDELSEFLKFREGTKVTATKITGSLPAAPDGGWKIDAGDTIYVVKGYPVGDRIQVLGPTGSSSGSVNGMYVAVVGSQFYFDVPGGATSNTWIDEHGDHHTTYTFSLDLDLENITEEIEYPFSAEIIIQPYDDSGAPLDEFERTITVEDPENSCNDIRTVYNNANQAGRKIGWNWEFSIYVDKNSGDVEDFSAPGLKYISKDTLARGCCGGLDGKTTLWPATYPGCHAGSDTWRELPIDPYYVPLFSNIALMIDGNALLYARDVQHNFDQSNTNLCKMEAAYRDKDEVYIGTTGKHNFTPGASRLEVTFDDLSSFAKPLRSSEIIYTCHSLLMFIPNGEGQEIGQIYKTEAQGQDFYAFEKLWLD